MRHGAGSSLGAEILEAARRLYFEVGPAGVTSRKIAAVVGCTAPAIYRHYDGMQDVFHALRMEGHGLLDSVASSLTELFAGGIMLERIAASR